MKTLSKACYAGLLLAALTPYALAAYQAEPAKPDSAVTPTPTAAPAAEAPLHEVGAAPTMAPMAGVPVQPSAPKGLSRHRRGHDDDDNRVTVNDDNIIGPDETVVGNAVAVLAPLTVDGTVEGNGVSILGRTTINGTVHGNAVAVLGDMVLGPNARLDGNAVSVGGRVIKDPSAIIGGNSVPINSGADLSDNGTASSLWRHGFRMGRPVAIGPHLHVFWLANLLVAALYMLLALLFPNGVRKCADTLELRPGITFLTGILAILGLPVLFVLLSVTVVGLPVAFIVLPLAILGCLLFGKAAVYSFIGRSILGKPAHIVLSVLVGILIALAVYFIPLVGFAVWFLIAFLGFACALTTLFSSARPAPPAGTPPAAPIQPVAAPVAGAAFVAVATDPAGTPVPAEAPLLAATPPVVAAAVPVAAPPIPPGLEARYPRAGFWIRMVALLIDAILVGVVTHLLAITHRVDEVVLLILALYGAVLWKLKGSTVGGIVFGLKVVRTDGRPIDWATALVRALACFLSLIFFCIGFIWIAFDPEKQAWHDKIAGTAVVRLPKGVSLV